MKQNDIDAQYLRALNKWDTCLELFYWLRGFNAGVAPDKRVPERYLEALAGVLGESPERPVSDFEKRLARLEAKAMQDVRLTAPTQWLPSASDQE